MRYSAETIPSGLLFEREMRIEIILTILPLFLLVNSFQDVRAAGAPIPRYEPNDLGIEKGQPPEVGNKIAFGRLKRIMEDKYALTHYLFGFLYYYGCVVPQDYQESIKWYTHAAKQGHAQAQHDLGRMYHIGLGVPEDTQRAAQWLIRAAKQGSAPAQCQLGTIYLEDNSGLQDDVTAARWFRLAAEQGYAPAQNALGLMYHSGRRVIKDHIEAYKWYVLATMQGDEFAQFAQELREHLDRTMTLDQIEDGQRRAREFLAVVEKSPKEDRRIAETVTQ